MMDAFRKNLVCRMWDDGNGSGDGELVDLRIEC